MQRLIAGPQVNICDECVRLCSDIICDLTAHEEVRTGVAGAAFLDRTGAVQAADDGFRAILGLPAEGITEALRSKAATAPGLAELISGAGPASTIVGGADGAVVVERTEGPGGLLLVAHYADDREQPPQRTPS